ncbi:Protein of uncharacterised function (DUF3015) [Pseudomonas aeruginosa]|nr:Protein of uncharacterised function (DUF3015) [Pseudomonas aeruginosa]
MDKRLLSKGLVLGLLSLGSMTAYADAAGGNGCGWGNMVFEGQRGLFPHLLATTTNGTSGNATFGMTSGTNGCNTNARLGYGGRSIFAMNGMLDNIAEDMAKGQGEALDAYAVLLGVEAKDRAHFAQVTQQHFGEIFASQDATGEQVLSNTLAVMESRWHPGALRQAAGLILPGLGKSPLRRAFSWARGNCRAWPEASQGLVGTARTRRIHQFFPIAGNIRPEGLRSCHSFRSLPPGPAGHGLFRRIPATLRLPPSRGNRSRLRSYDPRSVRG